MIEDDELREIYQVSSAEHLHNLETGLLELEKHPGEENLLHPLFREAHSLKGDSRITGVKSVEMLAHKVEEIFGSLRKGEIQLNSGLCDRLYQSFDTMGKLVQEAVTDEPSGVNVQIILNRLAGITSNKVQPTPVLSIGSTFIEDEDLRNIYQISSEEHLEKLKTGLKLLEEHPEEASLEELINETQSFQLDSRMVGREDLESLIGKTEEILARLKEQQLSLSQVQTPLDLALKAIASLVNEAVTGKPSEINSRQVLTQLIEVTALSDGSDMVSTAQPLKHLDTIRLPMRHLDALMTQTGELTVARTGFAYTLACVSKMAKLWTDWKLQKNHNPAKAQLYEEQIEAMVAQLKVTASENQARLEFITDALEENVRTLRLLPLSTVFLLFPRMVRDLARQENKQIELIIEGGSTSVDKQILEEIRDPLMHLIRNAIDHGIESPQEREYLGKSPVGTIRLRGYKTTNSIIIEVSDDGQGLNIEQIKQTAIKRKLHRREELEAMSEQQIYDLIFVPGFSTRSFITEISGRGVGLDVVRTNVERLKGNIQVESNAEHGCTFRLQIGTTLSTANVMLIEVAGITHALPLEYIVTSLLVAPDDLFTLEGTQTINVDGQPITVAKLAQILELSVSQNLSQAKKRLSQQEKQSCIIIQVGQTRLGLFVDNLLDIQEVFLKPRSELLKRVPHISGATILGTGEVCTILNPPEILKSVQQATLAGTVTQVESREPETKPIILLTEDSIAVRTQEKRILEKAGYEVVTAVDGIDGLQKLKTRHFDGIISDVEMPNLDGLSFTHRVRQMPQYQDIPIILVTSLASEEDRRKGAQAGANAYIVKDQFNQEVLLETLERLV